MITTHYTTTWSSTLDSNRRRRLKIGFNWLIIKKAKKEDSLHTLNHDDDNNNNLWRGVLKMLMFPNEIIIKKSLKHFMSFGFSSHFWMMLMVTRNFSIMWRMWSVIPILVVVTCSSEEWTLSGFYQSLWPEANADLVSDASGGRKKRRGTCHKRESPPENESDEEKRERERASGHIKS